MYICVYSSNSTSGDIVSEASQEPEFKMASATFVLLLSNRLGIRLNQLAIRFQL